jgi:hypothetical protein
MEKQKIIVINGPAASGKDTFVTFFQRYARCAVFEWSTVYTLKSMAMAVLGWNGIKDEPGRRLLSDLKDAWTRYNDGPFKEICEKIRYYDQCFERFVLFLHIREPAEIEKVIATYQSRVTTIYIKGRSQEIPNNHADQNTNAYNYNCVIDNTTTLKSLEVAARGLAHALTEVYAA